MRTPDRIALTARSLAAYRRVQRDGLNLGMLPEIAATVSPRTPIVLDHDLDVAPELGRELNVRKLVDLVNDLAGRLRQAGVRADDQVVVHKAPNADLWILACAICRLGAVPVMLSSTLDAESVRALVRKLNRPHLLTDARRLEALDPAAVEGITTSVILADRGTRTGTDSGTGSGPARSLHDLKAGGPVTPVRRQIDDAAVITHTSGTTGLPKLVVHTARTQAVRLRPQWRLLTAIRRDETVAIRIPFLHSRMVAAMALALLRGMPVLLMDESSPDVIADFFLKHRPGFIEALPTTFMEWERLGEDARRPLSSVRVFSSTFDAIHPRTVTSLLRGSDRRRPLFFQIYGQSEVGPATGRPYFGQSAGKVNGRCVGWPMPYGAARVRVVPRHGERPGPDTPGYVEVAWSGLAKTYLGDEDRYAANRRGDWWRTGDVGYRTRFGCLHVLDREVDMIPGLGSCLDLEDQILELMPELSELVIVRGPDGHPVPVVTTHDDLTLDEQRWREASRQFPAVGTPIQLREDDLPRTGTLKVRRLALQDRIAATTGGPQ